MANWLNLTKKEQIDLFNQVSVITGLPPFAVEKDAWVTLSLRMLFSSELKSHIVFKGGTSLSKCYNLIKRFSEDIDFSINRDFLGFSGELTKGQIRKLRRASHNFILNKLPEILLNELKNYGIEKNHFSIEVPNTEISDQDPETLLINYNSVFDKESYLSPRVQIEIGARALIEPFEVKEINSIIDSNMIDADFSEEKFKVNTVIPAKTLMEKLILLHEEFKKPSDKIRSHRMSRHLYDIVQIMETDYFEQAKNDKKLFKDICVHREKFTPIKPIGTVDYNKLNFENVQIIPPEEIIDKYRSDYKEMQSTMFYGESPAFDEVIAKMKTITNR